MPTWKCERCVQVNSATRTVCRHCHTPLVRSAATFIAHGRPTGQTGAVAAPVAAGNDRAGCAAQAQALLGGRSVVFFDESPEQRGERKDGLCVGGLVTTHESAVAAKQQWPDRAPSTYYGCRVQVESTWCALKGKCGRILSVVSPCAASPQGQGPRDQLQRDAVGRIVTEDGAVRMHAPGKAKEERILSVASPAASAPTSEQGPQDQLQRDAVGRIVTEDAAVRMHATGKAASKVPLLSLPLCTFLLPCFPPAAPRPQLHGRR